MNTLAPAENKFHVGNGSDGKHYWLTPPDLYRKLDAEFAFDFDPCPYPRPEGFDGLTCEWGKSNYVNPPFGSIIHQGKKKGPTAWVRRTIEQRALHNRGSYFVYPIDKWVLMFVKDILGDHAEIRNLGDIRWCAIEDGTPGKGTGRHIAAFVLKRKLNATVIVTDWKADGTPLLSTSLPASESSSVQPSAGRYEEMIEEAVKAISNADANDGISYREMAEVTAKCWGLTSK